MSKTKLNNLHAAAKEAVSTDNPANKKEALTRAFKLFSEETNRLEAAHAALKKEFEEVNAQLEQTNKRLNQKLKELDTSSSYLRNILINMSQGLLFINKAGIITTFNKSAEVILGKSAVEVLFQPFQQSFNDKLFGFSIQEALDKKAAPPASFAAISHNRELEVDAKYVVKKEGAEISKHLDPTLDYTEGLIILVRDVSEMRRLKNLADRNDRLKELGEMAAMVAHEIRNPLGGIKGFASLLRRDLDDQPRLQQMADYIVEGTDILNHLVTNVLNYARPIQPLLAPTNLNQLMEEVREKVAIDESLNKNIQIEINADAAVTAFIDAQLIHGIMLNLIINAVEAMPDGGIVSIWLGEDGDQAVIKVTDTGVGIPSENLVKVFSPFFTTKPRGNGFGLSEVYKIIQAHAGTIEANSTLGKGTTFTIKIPLKPLT